MRALVVFESMFGNTKHVADAVADGIARHMTVETVEVSMAPMAIDSDIDLLVIGGPTHVHGMTSTLTRAQATKQAMGHVVSDGIGMREWLDQVRPSRPAVPAAAFDTRINRAAFLTGSAAIGFAKRLRNASFKVIAPAESFLIDSKAPQDDALLDGELPRARGWGAELALQVVGRVAVSVG